MVNFNLVSLLSLPLALTSAFVPSQTRSLAGPSPSLALKSPPAFGMGQKQDMALFAAPTTLSDDQLEAIVGDILRENGVTGVTAADVAKTIKEPIANQSGDGSLSRIGVASDENSLDSVFAAVARSSAGISIASVEALDACTYASIEFGIEAVSLGLQAAGLPGGAGKKVAKILVNRVKAKLKKEIKKIVKEYFNSVNPFKNAQGLVAIFNIIIGDLGFSEFSSIVLGAVSWWDAIQVAVLLSAYFLTGGGGLAVKLASLVPQTLDVIEAGIEVSNAC